MTTNDPCPRPEVLGRLVAGELSTPLESRWIAHLDRCEQCRKTLDENPSSLAIAERLPGLNSDALASPLLQAALQEVKSKQDPWMSVRGGEMFGGASFDEASFTFSADGFDDVQPLGRGAMGIVFKAREVSLDRIVAIKVLSPILGAQKTARERFLREAQAAAAIKHPNVITIYRVDDNQELPFLVMEFVDGESLQDRIDAGFLFDTEQVIRVGRQMAAGLAAAHANGVVHRDIKPANILLESESGDVKVSDFGLAHVTGQSSLTQTGMLVGTPAFVAPELLVENVEPDHRADLFSLGSVLYAMYSGTSPFDAGSVLATLHRISAVEPRPIQERVANVPNGIAAIISKLLAKDPGQRFQSAAELDEALRDGLLGNGQVASPVVTTSPVQPPPIQTPPPTHTRLADVKRKHPRWWLAVSGVLLIAIAALAWWTTGPKNRSQFSVIHDDGSVTAYPSLQEALEEADDGTRVEIRGNGPFELAETYLDQESLTIAAAPGDSPVIFFTPNGESEIELDWDDEDDEVPGLFNSSGELHLEGLDLRFESREHEARSLIHIDDSEFTATRCQFFVTEEGCCVTGDGLSELELTGCDLQSAEGCAVNLILQLGARVDIRDCVLAGSVGIEIEVAEDCRVSLTECTLVAPRVFELVDDTWGDREPNPLSVVATKSFFASRDGLIQLPEATRNVNELRDVLHWRGESNLYAGPFVAFEDEEQGDGPGWAEDFASWKRVTKESKSEHRKALFDLSTDEWFDSVFDSNEQGIGLSLRQEVATTNGGLIGARPPRDS